MAAKKSRAKRGKGTRGALWHVSAPGKSLVPGDPVPPDAIVWRETPGGGIWAKRAGSPVLIHAVRAPQPPPPAAPDLLPYRPPYSVLADARSWGDWKRGHYLSRLDRLADSLAEIGGAVFLDGSDVRPRTPAEVLLRDASRWERPGAQLTFALPKRMAADHRAHDRAASKARALCSAIYSFWRAVRAQSGTESIYWTVRYYEAFLEAYPGEDAFGFQRQGATANKVRARGRRDAVRARFEELRAARPNAKKIALDILLGEELGVSAERARKLRS